MNSNKFWAAVGRTLAAVTVILILVLVLAPGAWAGKFKTLHKFKSHQQDGLLPYGSLVFDAAGNLYGTTEAGGVGDNLGTVFKLSPNADGKWTETVLYSFTGFITGDDGQEPLAGLVFDQAGNLYGTTAYNGGSGGGTVFELSPNPDGSWTESVLHSFNYDDGGGYRPTASLLLDLAGNLYGTADYGGAYDNGVVFELSPNPDGSWTENVLYSFTGGEDGGEPHAGLTFDAAGNLYGTTTGYVSGGGNIFQLIPNQDGTWTEKVLYSFTGGNDGIAPYARVIFDQSGNLYGTTNGGGAYGYGVVFRLKPTAKGKWKETVLHEFNGTDGAYPYAGVIRDQSGHLYGTTWAGGAYGYGTIFRLKRVKGGWKETVLRSFNNKPEAYPWADLIFDTAGNLYGTTVGHDTGEACVHGPCGSVFEITP
jgi:uncharacterized repeat protein (TIGR03803 family)